MDQDVQPFGPPYGPASNLKTIFETWRDRSMPEIIDKDWLERIGISQNLTTKNLHALRFLGMIDEEGFTTAVASRLRVASAEEYPGVLEEVIRKAYRRVFEIRNPSEDSRLRIEDAFRREQPQAQRPRMVACFLGLCQMALMPLREAPPVREAHAPRVGVSRKARALPSNPSYANQSRSAEVVPQAIPTRRPSVVLPGNFDPILAGLINTLPQIEEAEELDQWYSVFKSAFTLIHSLNEKRRDSD